MQTPVDCEEYLDDLRSEFASISIRTVEQSRGAKIINRSKHGSANFD